MNAYALSVLLPLAGVIGVLWYVAVVTDPANQERPMKDGRDF